jgi:hypothetical protein
MSERGNFTAVFAGMTLGAEAIIADGRRVILTCAPEHGTAAETRKNGLMT